jgi:mannan endo-1,4-beta-mannosidase
VKKAGAPVMIRLAHEMNGDWYPWATAFKNRAARHNGNSPEHYTAMWRRVVVIFRAEGATNARWVWAPNIFYMNGANSLQAQKRDLAALYPGDKWVDWVGLSVYNDGAKRPWRSFDSLFSDSYATLAAISHKPMMIAEIGVTEQGAPRGESKARWIEQTFLEGIPYRYPRVQLVNYFSRDKTSHGESNYRFDSSEGSLQAFRRVALSPLYQGRIER